MGAEIIHGDTETRKEFIAAAKKKGVMEPRLTNLKTLCGFKKKKKKKKAEEKEEKPKAKKPRSKDPAEQKREAREEIEGFLRSNGVWQIDIFDVLTDSFEVYSVSEFKENVDDEEEDLDDGTTWTDRFLNLCKKRGVMEPRYSKLATLCGKKAKKKKKKTDGQKQKKKKVVKEKVLDEAEIERRAREKMEPMMKANGFWKLDLFLILLRPDDYELEHEAVYEPAQLANLSKRERKEILNVGKKKGLMKPRRDKFKAYCDAL